MHAAACRAVDWASFWASAWRQTTGKPDRPPGIPTDSDDFYASIPLREKLNQRWLSQQLGILDGTLAHFPWGTTGVARDKSENAFIYLHNRHNSWVFGD
ncbi:MAG: hypothetical protein E6Q72_00715 [Pseudomonas sp.]|nr:MAG: hypothetical protein E6Q72_00715 [Pseudomonas sp.]